MTDSLTQLRPEDARDDFIPQAVIRRDPEALNRSKRILFLSDEDDLGGFEAAFLRLGPAGDRMAGPGTVIGPAAPGSAPDPDAAGTAAKPLVFMLQRYAREPLGQLTVFLGAGLASSRDADNAIGRVLDALDVGAAELVWRRGRDTGRPGEEGR